MNIESINKYMINKLIKNDIPIRITNLSNELLETLNMIENCTSCENNIGKCNDDNLDEFHESINDIENNLARLEKEEEEQEKEIINRILIYKLVYMDLGLNKKILCESCKGKRIEKLTDKCGNEKMYKLLYEYKLNGNYYNYI